jgi:cellulose synthase (UDP-forming)
MTPFARPLLIQVILFVITFIAVFITRRFYTPESELVLNAEKTWGMLGFAAVASLVASGGLYATWESTGLSEEDPWNSIDIPDIKS